MNRAKIFLAILIFSAPGAWAKSYGSSSSGSSGGALSSVGGGEDAFGFMGGVVNASQDQMNELQRNANTRVGGITTGQLTSADEIAAFYMYRFPGTMYAIQIRPSYFYQRQDGSGNPGQFTYAVQGWTIFPLLRLYPLENDIMKFYMQVGLGYGQVTGHVAEGPGVNATFGSGAFGTVVGMGAEFCLTANSCINFEGDYRYLDFNRNIVTSSNGTFASGTNGSLSQAQIGREAEIDGGDLDLRMGGVMFLAGYTYWF